MAKFGKYRIQRRKGASFFGAVMKTVKFVLLAYVGGLVLLNIANVLNVSQGCVNSTGGTTAVDVCNPMTTAFTLLGLTSANSGAVTLGTTGLISIIGILGAIYLVMNFVQVRRA